MVIDIVSFVIALLLLVIARIFINIYHPTRRELRRILGLKNKELTKTEIWDRINSIINNNIGNKIIRNGYHIFVKPYNANKNDERIALVHCGNNITLSVGRRFDDKLGRVRNVCYVIFPEDTESYLHMIRTWGTDNDVNKMIGSRRIPVKENRKVIIKRYIDYILNRIL
jgi:hypothetical protein